MRKADKKTGRISFRETLHLSKRGYMLWWSLYPEMLISSAVCAVVGALTPYVGIVLSAKIINEIADGRDREVLTGLVLLSLGSAAVLSLLNAVLGRWKNYCHAGEWYKRNRIYAEKQLAFDYASVEDPHIRDLLSQIQQNENWSAWGLAKLIWNYNSVIGSVVGILGAVALSVGLFTAKVPENGGPLTALNHPAMVAAVLLVMLAVTFLAPMLGNKAGSYWAKYADSAKLGNRIFSFFGFMGYRRHRALDIRMYRQDLLCRHEMSRGSNFGPKSAIARKGWGAMGFFHGGSAAVSQMFAGIVYVFVCLKALGGAFGVGSATQYIGAVTALSGGVASLVGALGTLRNNTPFLRTTFEFLDTPGRMYQGSLSTEKRSDNKYEITFRNVSFKYPSSEEYALRNVSLSFRVGQRLAVVGRNGSGKTTLIKLLCRLYDPTEGEILLNGIDIRKYDYAQYMDIFSVVFQDFSLLSFSLGQNVAAAFSYDGERVRDCLEKAGFADRLDAMPKGLDTCLYKNFDENGVEISGGEAQKIALGRALYKDAPFVILDEPTAALDPVAEFEVYRRMNEMVGGKTAVFISHRLSSCRFCEDIAVFHEGRLIQRGGHEELLSDETGKYHELWNAQARYYSSPTKG